MKQIPHPPHPLLYLPLAFLVIPHSCLVQSPLKLMEISSCHPWKQAWGFSRIQTSLNQECNFLLSSSPVAVALRLPLICIGVFLLSSNWPIFLNQMSALQFCWSQLVVIHHRGLKSLVPKGSFSVMGTCLPLLSDWSQTGNYLKMFFIAVRGSGNIKESFSCVTKEEEMVASLLAIAVSCYASVKGIPCNNALSMSRGAAKLVVLDFALWGDGVSGLNIWRKTRRLCGITGLSAGQTDPACLFCNKLHSPSSLFESLLDKSSETEGWAAEQDKEDPWSISLIAFWPLPSTHCCCETRRDLGWEGRGRHVRCYWIRKPSFLGFCCSLNG